MNKRTLLLAALLFIGTIAQAQSLRLKATTTNIWHAADFRLLDTGTYTYTGNRGPTNPDNDAPWPWAADHVIHQFYDSSTATYTNTAKYAFEFDNDDRVTAFYFMQWANGVWDTTQSQQHHYNTNGQVDTTIRRSKNNGVWTLLDKRISVYGQSGVTFRILQQWDDVLMQFVDQYKFTTTYTGQQPTEELTEQWNGSAWMPFIRYTSVYSGDNLVSYMRENYNSGWENYSLTQYEYDTEDDAIEVKELMWLSGAWTEMSRTLNSYIDHKLITEIQQHWDGTQYVNEQLMLQTYNTANLIQWVELLQWDDVTASFNVQEDVSVAYAFYYEPYTPNSVGNIEQQSASFLVYPNPSTNTINITSQAAHASPFSITIFDATGKSVKHWNEPPATFYQKQVDISNLPSGNYFLRISDRPQEAVQFTILR